jgi:hypothetical protein
MAGPSTPPATVEASARSQAARIGHSNGSGAGRPSRSMSTGRWWLRQFKAGRVCRMKHSALVPYQACDVFECATAAVFDQQ